MSFEADSWLAGVEDDPDPAEEGRRCGGGRVHAIDRDPASKPGPDDPRDEPGGRQCEGGLARAGSPRHPDPLPGPHRDRDLLDGGHSPSRVADREPLD